MVKTVFAALVLFLIAVPALAQQEDFPRIQMGFGYANLSIAVPTCTVVNLDGTCATIDNSNHHSSGFMSNMNFNFTRNIGLDYYLGYYSIPAGGGSSNYLFTNIFGAKLMYPTDKITPFVVAGIGIGSGLSGYSCSFYGCTSGSAATYRLGGGADYKLSDAFYIRVDISKLQVHSSGWVGGANIAGGLVFTLMQ